MTSTLCSGNSSLLQHYPDGALLLLGLPGMPNTHWPRSMNLTSASQGRAASQLLKHLIGPSSWTLLFLRPDVPVFWVGVGNGAMSVLQVALTALREEEEQPAARLHGALHGHQRLRLRGRVTADDGQPPNSAAGHAHSAAARPGAPTSATPWPAPWRARPRRPATSSPWAAAASHRRRVGLTTAAGAKLWPEELLETRGELGSRRPTRRSTSCSTKRIGSSRWARRGRRGWTRC